VVQLMSLESSSPDVRDRVEQTLRLSTARLSTARLSTAGAALQERGIQPLFVANRHTALAKVLELIPRNSAVAHGHSTTLEEIGLVAHLSRADSPYRYLNAEWLAEDDAVSRQRLRARLSLEADYYLGSVQAICETGEVIGTDKSGSRQAFYIYGPPHVIWVAGLNKLVPTLDEGLRRVHEVAQPLEDERIKQAGGQGSFISKLVIYEREDPGRITLILVGEPLGF
jgi:hypothetical protein